MESGSSGEEPTSWDELYSINLMPSEFFLKFRKEIQNFRVAVNFEVISTFQPTNHVHAINNLLYFASKLAFNIVFYPFLILGLIDSLNIWTFSLWFELVVTSECYDTCWLLICWHVVLIGAVLQCSMQWISGQACVETFDSWMEVEISLWAYSSRCSNSLQKDPINQVSESPGLMKFVPFLSMLFGEIYVYT